MELFFALLYTSFTSTKYLIQFNAIGEILFNVINLECYLSVEDFKFMENFLFVWSSQIKKEKYPQEMENLRLDSCLWKMDFKLTKAYENQLK